MSVKDRNNLALNWHTYGIVFAALGNQIRLALITKLMDGQPKSIIQLTASSKLTRQAITKHLLILEEAKIVISVRSGRESLYQYNPKPIKKINEFLTRISEEWDQALVRLKSFVEN